MDIKFAIFLSLIHYDSARHEALYDISKHMGKLSTLQRIINLITI